MGQVYNSPYNHKKYPKKIHIPTISKRAQCIGSLLMSIAKAGGYVPMFHPEKLKNVSVMEFIECSVGQNNIKFYFDKPEK